MRHAHHVLALTAVVVAGLLVPRGAAEAALQYQFVDLHVPGTQRTMAEGVDGGRAVGNQFTPGESERALYWPVAGQPPVSLHPAGFSRSRAVGISGDVQVGFGDLPTASHALMWTGAADRVTDLHPAAFASSTATGVGGGRQVGRGVTAAGAGHALLWSGSAASAVDLQPDGFFRPGRLPPTGCNRAASASHLPGRRTTRSCGPGRRRARLTSCP